ncbi:hypothetical protein D0T84_06460 [Dysgonomonas sp. 521]|uniref:helix-turn-helix and ligand-binding sensor domain-containing protein n=1 Tax=Dysgonomonas sp. 521 TaxID=2302932 RepID=UPI0013D0B731|nr:triple tyrosine motif-containing protein [Dysgonomonas sp. 521]NDV94564.1 hypothetical protein [Dysgonomonas sp. 521]
MKHILRIISYILFLLVPVFIYPDTIWQRKIINYERNQYKAGFQNWMIAQSENGWIYCANSNGLLEFDGVNWTSYPIRNNVMRSLKIIDKRVYIGGSTEFGYFEPNQIGLLTYHSLSEKTKDWGGEVWNIIDNDNVIYFLSERYIHTYNKKANGVTSVNTNIKIDCSTLYKGKLYIGTTDGIFYLDDNNKIMLLESSKPLTGRKLVSLLPYKNDILVTSAQAGLYLLNTNDIQKIQSIADSFISKNQLFSTTISGSKIALGSVQNGVLIFDFDKPAYKEEFNLNNGLRNNTVLSCFFDKEQNLWLGLDKGISYINLNSPIRPLFATASPLGTGYWSTVYNDELYFGTNQALYKLDKEGNYKLIKDSEGQIWSINIIENSLFSSGDNGIIVITATETYKINLQGAWETHALAADRERLIVATYSGFHILKRENGRWAYSHKVPDFFDSCRGSIEDNEPYTFWIANASGYIQRITFDPGFTKIVKQKAYPFNNETFDANIIFRKIDNNLVICTDNGILYYSRISDSFDHYTQLESMLEGPKYYEFLFVDKLKNIWFVADNNLKMLSYTDGKYQGNIHNWGLSNELIDSYENIYLTDSATAIVSVDNAFMKIDLSKKRNSPLPTNTYIRKITNSRNDSILSYGGKGKSISLPYSLNSIRIHFAATSYEHSSDILYMYRLKGLDENWSIPSTNTLKEYTNLDEGKYTFEVKAFIDGNPDSTNVTSVMFIVQPPWYRSLLAYLLYSLAAAILILILYKKTISKQKRIIHQKGEELIAQTKRHEEETKLKDQEIYELQNENLKSELKYKTQELNGYILNVIRKNEMFEDIKKNALNISKAIDEEKQMSTIKQKVMRLISQINSNIEHDTDFKVFESNFDLIHQDFFKLLDERFPGLSRNEKILCAYLNMNLSTKEIAPLLNISVRGVEVNRYRLRKKMNLDRDVNLSEFLHNLK